MEWQVVAGRWVGVVEVRVLGGQGEGMWWGRRWRSGRRLGSNIFLF